MMSMKQEILSNACPKQKAKAVELWICDAWFDSGKELE